MPFFVRAPSVDASFSRRVGQPRRRSIVRVGAPGASCICLLGQQYESGAAPDGPHRVAELPEPSTPCRRDSSTITKKQPHHGPAPPNACGPSSRRRSIARERTASI